MAVDNATWVNVEASAVANGFTCASKTDTRTTECSSTTACSVLVAASTTTDNVEIVLASAMTLTIPAAGYLLSASATTCSLAITNDWDMPAGRLALGSLFLASYYAEFDYATMQVSLGVSSATTAWTSAIATYTPPTPPTPTPTPSTGMAWWAVLLIVIACLLVLVIIVLLVRHFFFNKDKSAIERNKITEDRENLVTKDDEAQDLGASLN